MSNNLESYSTDSQKTFLTTVEVVFQSGISKGVFTYTHKIHGVISLPSAEHIVEDLACGNMEIDEFVSVNGAKISYDDVFQDFKLWLVDSAMNVYEHEIEEESELADMITSIRIIKQEEIKNKG